MKLRRRLIPVAALVVAIGASAAGAATAAESGGSGNAGGSGAKEKASCEIKLDGDTFKKGVAAKIEAKIGSKSGAKAGDKLDGTLDGTLQDKLDGKLAGKTPGQAPDKASDKGRIVPKGSVPPPSNACEKKVAVIGLDTVAAKLGVTKPALVLALKQTGQWVASSPTKPSVAQVEQHLADLLHVPVAKVASVIGIGQHTVMKPGA